MASYHAISDSDSDNTIDPTDTPNILASDTDPDSPAKTPRKKLSLVHSKSLHAISESDSDDETVIPPTQPKSATKTKQTVHKKPAKLSSSKSKPKEHKVKHGHKSTSSKGSYQHDLFGSDSDDGHKPDKGTALASKGSYQHDLFGSDSDDGHKPDKGTASVSKGRYQHDLFGSDSDNDDKLVAELANVTSSVTGASLGRKLSKDPTMVQQWAGGQGAKRARDDSDSRPVCKDGRLCLRKTQAHFEEYRHPESVTHKDEWQVEKKSRLKSPEAGSATKTPFSFYLSKVTGIPEKYNDVNSLDIKDILSPSMGNLQKSAQFSYVYDIPWLVNQYPPCFRKLPLTVVHGFQRNEKKAIEMEAKPFPNITLCRGKLEIMYGTHHTKMMFLVYDNGLRVVITTANLIGKDWAQKTQGLWMSPLYPKLTEESPTKGDSPTHFKQDLLQYLAVYADPAMAEWLAVVRHHDMSATRVYLIASVPGRHIGPHRSSFGHLKLQKILSEHGPKAETVKDWPVVAQFSSVGSLGSSAEAWLTGEFRGSLATTRGPKNAQKPEIKLVYPSKANVRESLEGYPAGASLPYSINTAKKQTWLHTFWHHWYAEVRGRSPASPHIKTYLRSDPDWRNLAWFIVTSANLSKAAWGALEKAGSQLMIRSYEIGVLFIPEAFDLETFEALRTDTDDPTAKNVFPVPYDLPPTHYDIKVGE